MNASRWRFMAWSNTMQLKNLWIYLFSLLFFISGCAPMESQGSGGKPDYKETKTMVLDILRTEDGKKAIQEVLSKEETKQELLLSEPFVQKTIQDAFLDPENKKKMQTMMANPKFRKE